MRLTHADTEVENLFSKRQTKSRREDVMPLPMATGKAIAAYLKHERPKTDSRAVFVRYNAPPGLPVGPDLVRKAIRQAYARAGLPYTRSHLLRHTTAMHLLQSGVPFNVIALWLGHESTNTTHRYVEADLTMKTKALAQLKAPATKIPRYRVPDSLIQCLQTL